MVHSFCWGHSIDLKCHEFNALLALASRRGRWYEAIELLTRAPSLKVTPDIATWKWLSIVNFQYVSNPFCFHLYPCTWEDLQNWIDCYWSLPMNGSITTRQAIHLWSLLMPKTLHFGRQPWPNCEICQLGFLQMFLLMVQPSVLSQEHPKLD